MRDNRGEVAYYITGIDPTELTECDITLNRQGYHIGTIETTVELTIVLENEKSTIIINNPKTYSNEDMLRVENLKKQLRKRGYEPSVSIKGVNL